MQAPRTHAVREFHRNDSEVDFWVEEIRRVGYTVVDSGYPEDELQRIREILDRVYATQVREIGDEEKLRSIDDASVARCLIAYDDYFVKLAIHPKIISIGTKLLGEYFLLMSQNGIINRSPDEHYQTWHRDLNYQHFVSSRPLAFSALYAIDEFTAETGGTCILPSSHKSEVFPSNEYIERHQVQMNAKPGDILIFDAMLYHRAGQNVSGRTRRAVNHIYTLPLIKQQISFPKVLGGKFSDDPYLRKFLGYETETADSVDDWRRFKLSMVGQKR